MALGRARILGIALGNERLSLAELHFAKGGAGVRIAEEFIFPGGLSLDQPAVLGKVLRDRLQRAGIRTTAAVFGVPASWTLVREARFPKSNRATLENMVRLKVEQIFPSEGVVADYAAGPAVTGPSGDSGQPVLMAAINREKLDAIVQLAEAAGLTVAGVMPTIAALGRLRPSAKGRRLLIHLNSHSAEVALAVQGVPAVVRHVPLPRQENALDDLAASLRRLTALLPSGPAAAPMENCVVWGHAPWTARAISDSLGLPVTLPKEVSELGVRIETKDVPAIENLAAPVALAVCRLSPEGLPLDFQHSRLAAPPKRFFGRKAAWAAALAATVLLAAGFLFDDWRRSEREIGSLRAQVAQMQPDIDTARAVVGRAQFARGWFNRRPYYLDCLRTVALCFPEEGRIWITSMGVRDDMQTVISGQAADERTVLDTLDKLKQSKDLGDVRMIHVRDGGGRNREVSFAIQFVFVGKAPRQ